MFEALRDWGDEASWWKDQKEDQFIKSSEKKWRWIQAFWGLLLMKSQPCFLYLDQAGPGLILEGYTGPTL